MAKKAKTTAYGLRFGHPNIFRRTIQIGKGANATRFQMVFEPNVPYELSDEEVAALKPEIEDGIIELWNDGKQRRRPAATAPTSNATAQVEALQVENAELRAQVEELTAMVAGATDPGNGPDAPIGDEE